MQLKKHAWWGIPVVTLLITSAAYGISWVYATNVEVIQLKVIIPEVREHMRKIDTKLETLDEKADDINGRLSNIEGRLKR